MQSLDPILETFRAFGREFMQALESGDFYVELIFLSVALAVSILLAALMRSFINRALRAHPRRGLSQELLAKALGLLTPLLAVIALTSMKPLAEHLIHEPLLITASIELSVAWLLASAVLLLVRTRPVAWFIIAVIFFYTLLNVTGFMHSTAGYLDGIGISLGKFQLSMLGLIKGVIIFVIVFWMAGAASRTLEAYLRRVQALSYSSRELIVKFFTLSVYFIAFIITLGAMGVDLTALAVFGGALGVGIGLGLQKVTANFVSGVTILLEKSIKIGDLIEVGNNTGWVRRLHMRYALIETFDGRELLIPNEELISTRVTNWTYTTNNARIEIKVSVAYDSDAEKARLLMLAAASSHPRCLKDPEPSCVLREFGESGLIFMLTFWIPDVREGRYAPQSEVMFEIWRKFRENGIDIPYPRREIVTRAGA